MVTRIGGNRIQLNSLLAVNGIALDFIGAILLAGAVLKSDASIRQEGSTYFGFNTALIRSNVEARLHGIIGISFLLVGFIFQFMQYYLSAYQLPYYWRFSPALTVFLGILLIKIIKFLVLPNAKARVLALSYAGAFQKLRITGEGLDIAGDDLNCRRMPEENDRDYSMRLEDRVELINTN